AETFEHGTANGFRPAQSGIPCMRRSRGWPEAFASGRRQHHRTSKPLKKLPSSRPPRLHQKVNLAPAWKANGVLPGATWLMNPYAPGFDPCRVSPGKEASGPQLNPIAVEAGNSPPAPLHGVQFAAPLTVP